MDYNLYKSFGGIMDKRKDYLPTGLSITQVELDIVRKESEKRGINSFSATIRMIIREWDELKYGRKIEELGKGK
jgi:predicted oxidoreductase